MKYFPTPQMSHQLLHQAMQLQHKNLDDRLRDLLTPSTPQEELDQLQANRAKSRYYRAYLRTNEKRMDIEEWLQNDGRLHNGAHFPLCVFTKNASARSEAAEQRRRNKGKGKGWRQGETAVADHQGSRKGGQRKGGKHSRGKGKWVEVTAVAESETLFPQSRVSH